MKTIMENKKTAVEWIVLQFGFQGRNNQEMLYVKQIVEQAKAMEKEQIINGFNTAIKHQRTRDLHLNAEQYYNETYNVKDN